MDEQRVFTAALRIDNAAERDAYLDTACSDDPSLRERVENLLRNHPQVGAFMADPAVPARSPTIDQPVAEQTGTYIGVYKLIEEIGAGGMGTVFMALQKKPVRRKVALKVIKPGMDSKQVVSRFEAERQTLALMDHPNIAKVHDGGTTESGRPYFVMELVKGIPITEYCDNHRLTNRERLELFGNVCSAVHHAHQKGVIHRDLKPSNVLVTQLDDKPIPKIIDFGIAKAISGHLTDESFVTAVSQVVGTPMYMSPEQAELTATDIDTRSDVYSLGVLLYELLTGTTPFDGERMSSVSFDEFRRIVQEEDPPRPSTRLSTIDAALDTVAEKHHTDARSLSREVSGELDWIVMKALEKDRTRRYESANELAKDVQRYLNDAAVEACPPSTAYRLRKFTRRNRTVVLATAAIGLALLLGAGVAAGQAYRATKAERLANKQLRIANEQKRLAKEAAQRERELRTEAETARQQAEKVTEFLVDIFRSPDPQRDGRKVMVAEILDRAVQDLMGQFADQPLRKAYLLNALGQSYLGLGLYEDAANLFHEKLQIGQKVLGIADAYNRTAMNNLAVAYFSLGRYDEAVKLHEEVLQLEREHKGNEHPDTLSSMNNLANDYQAAGRYDEAVKLHEESLQLHRRQLGEKHAETLKVMLNLAGAYRAVRRFDEAVKLNEEVLHEYRQQLGEKHPYTLAAMNGLGVCYLNVGKSSEAVSLFEEALQLHRDHLGDEHPDTLISMNNLAQAYRAVGRADAAVKLLEETLQLQREQLGDAHPATLTTMYNLATVYEALGRYSEAVKLHEKALQLRREHLGDKHPRTLSSMNNLATVYQALGRNDEAVKLHEESLQLLRQQLGETHPETLTSMGSLAAAYWRMQQFDRSIPMFEELVRLRRKAVGEDHPDTLLTMANLGANYNSAGRTEEAVTLLEDTLQRCKRQLGSAHSTTLLTMNNLGANYLKADLPEKALPLFEEALDQRRKQFGPKHPQTLTTMANLSKACRRVGMLDRAVQLGDEAFGGMKEKMGPDHPTTLIVMRILEDAYAESGQLSRAVKLVAEAVQRQQQTLGRENPNTLDSMIRLGSLYVQQGNYEDAKPLLLEAKQGCLNRQATDRTPRDDQRLNDVLTQLVELYEKSNQPEKAAEATKELEEFKNSMEQEVPTDQ